METLSATALPMIFIWRRASRYSASASLGILAGVITMALARSMV
jgi:hypothetical protein